MQHGDIESLFNRNSFIFIPLSAFSSLQIITILNYNNYLQKFHISERGRRIFNLLSANNNQLITMQKHDMIINTQMVYIKSLQKESANDEKHKGKIDYKIERHFSSCLAWIYILTSFHHLACSIREASPDSGIEALLLALPHSLAHGQLVLRTWSVTSQLFHAHLSFFPNIQPTKLLESTFNFTITFIPIF